MMRRFLRRAVLRFRRVLISSQKGVVYFFSMEGREAGGPFCDGPFDFGCCGVDHGSRWDWAGRKYRQVAQQW